MVCQAITNCYYEQFFNKRLITLFLGAGCKALAERWRNAMGNRLTGRLGLTACGMETTGNGLPGTARFNRAVKHKIL
jgi:hypothetical protein